MYSEKKSTLGKLWSCADIEKNGSFDEENQLHICLFYHILLSQLSGGSLSVLVLKTERFDCDHGIKTKLKTTSYLFDKSKSFNKEKVN